MTKYRVTKLFISGALQGLTYVETLPADLAARFPIGTVVRKPIGGSPYRIIANELSTSSQ
jgi:hypothetical protein